MLNMLSLVKSLPFCVHLSVAFSLQLLVYWNFDIFALLSTESNNILLCLLSII